MQLSLRTITKVYNFATLYNCTTLGWVEDVDGSVLNLFRRYAFDDTHLWWGGS